MSKSVIIGFNANDNIKDFIDKAKWDLKVNRSKLIRRVFKFFIEHPEELKKINKIEEEKESDK